MRFWETLSCLEGKKIYIFLCQVPTTYNLFKFYFLLSANSQQFLARNAESGIFSV